MIARAFSDEHDPTDGEGAGDPQAVDYNFEGFTIEVSEKVMLTPAFPASARHTNGEARP